MDVSAYRSSPRDTVCLHPRQTLLPIPRSATILGAILGWCFWELLLVTCASFVGTMLTTIASSTNHAGVLGSAGTNDPALSEDVRYLVASASKGGSVDAVGVWQILIGIVAGATALGCIGVVHAMFDAYLRNIPPIAAAFVSPIFFGVSLSLFPVEVAPSLLVIAPIVTLLGINIGFYDPSLRLTNTVPGLTSHLYRRRAVNSSLFASVGLVVACILAGIALRIAMLSGIVVFACSLLWWWLAWQRSFTVIFLLTVSVQSGLLSIAMAVFTESPDWEVNAIVVGILVVLGGLGLRGLKRLNL